MVAVARKIDDLTSKLAAIVGERNLLTDPADMAPYLIDERKRYQGAARAVVRPGSTAEVAEIVRACRAAGVPIVPQGGNTGLCGAATPSENGDAVVLSLARMSRVREVDPLNYTITVEAGVILLDVQRAAEAHDRLFPLSLGGEGTARIGGNLSTNAGGTGVLRYGTARELALGLEVVLPDGRIWDGLNGLRKDNTGYDLKQMFIGAEGTLGIITAAVMKLFPLPKETETAFVAVPSVADAVKLLALARTMSDEKVTAFEWIPRLPLDFVLRHIPGARDPLATRYDHYVLMELSSGLAGSDLRGLVEAILEAGMQQGLALDAAIAESGAQADAFWKLRETIPEAQKFEGASVKHDVAVPVSRVADFLAAADRAVADAVPGIRICSFGHLGDGNVHYNLSRPQSSGDAAFDARYAELNRLVHDIVTAMKGSISAEHGIGRLRREELQHYKSPVALDLMKKIKAALDPDNLMNPGKVL
ncbi:MAG TPA: FAD-binding oxidoreductase [Alphaproteobacteria bacterium]